MDHAIEYLENYMTMDKEMFIQEWQSGRYEKITDCPSYSEVKAYYEAIRVLSKHHYGKDAACETPKKLLEGSESRGLFDSK